MESNHGVLLLLKKGKDKLKPRIALTKKQQEKLDFYLEIYSGTKLEIEYKLIREYTKQKKGWEQLQELENHEREQLGLKLLSGSIDSARKRYERWTKAFVEEKNHIIITKHANKNLVIEKILDNYPEYNLFSKTDDASLEWTPKRMQRVFRTRRRLRIKEYIFLLDGLGEVFSENDYQKGIERYIEQEMRKLPPLKSGFWLNKLKIQFSDISPVDTAIDYFRVDSNSNGNYIITVENSKGHEWNVAYILHAPKYRGKYKEYKANLSLKEMNKLKDKTFDCTCNPFINFFVGMERVEKFKRIKPLEIEDKKIKDIYEFDDLKYDMARRMQSSGKGFEDKIDDELKQCLYVKVQNNWVWVFENSVRNANIVKQLKAKEEDICRIEVLESTFL